jgi:hypothetical protein
MLGAVGIEDGGEVGGDADVRHDDVQIVLFDDLMADFFDLLDEFLRDLQARAAGRFQADEELSQHPCAENRPRRSLAAASAETASAATSAIKMSDGAFKALRSRRSKTFSSYSRSRG